MVKKNVLTGRSESMQSIINIFPKSLRLRFNPRRRSIELFMHEASKKVEKGSLILDAGAGPCPYKHFFTHTNYEATDFTNPHELMDFTCNLDNIPKPSDTYNAVISTEVLEHVENPQKVINEFYRILTQNGKLFLTTPQQFMIHQKPYNFFYFTYYGLEKLIKEAGFAKYKIIPMGGYFSALADMIKFNGLIDKKRTNKLIYYLLKIMGFPFTQILFPFILFHLDFLDKRKDWTMGYTVEATK